MLKGLDVSRWNGPGSVPWDEVDFGFVRLTYGLHVDPRADEHLWHGRKAGKLLGGYHWLDCSAGVWGGEQAELFLKKAENAATCGAADNVAPLALAVDVEPSDPRRPDLPDRVIDALGSFLITACASRPCAVYLNLSEAMRIEISGRGRRSLPDDLALAPLWLADWTPPVVVPKPWEAATILQTGKKGDVDRDAFEGTAEDFRRVFGLPVSTLPRRRDPADHLSSMRGDRG